MGQNPDAIREEIDAIRERMTQTTDAIGERVNPRTQLRERTAQSTRSLRFNACSVKDRAVRARRRYAANPALACAQAKAAAGHARTTLGDNPRSTITIAVTTASLIGGLIALILQARHARPQPRPVGDAVAQAVEASRSTVASLSRAQK